MASGILTGINTTISSVTDSGQKLLDFGRSIGSTINGIRDDASGATQCNTYIAQTQQDMDELQRNAQALQNQTQQSMQVLQVQIDAQLKANTQQLPILQQQQSQMQATQTQLEQQQAILQSKLNVYQDYQVKLQKYKEQLVDIEKQLKDCETRGLTRQMLIGLSVGSMIVSFKMRKPKKRQLQYGNNMKQ